jgi:hypothetical protein
MAPNKPVPALLRRDCQGKKIPKGEKNKANASFDAVSRVRGTNFERKSRKE